MSTTDTTGKKLRGNNKLPPPIKTETSKIRRPRPPTTEESKEHRVPLRSPMPSNEQKTSFRKIFRFKNKEDGPPSPAQSSPLFSPTSIKMSLKSPLNSPTLSDTFQSRTMSLASTVTEKPSRSKSKKEKRKSVAPAKPSRARSDSNTCDPLPLFRVYPQSIKHAKLATPTLPADTIIRNSNHKRNSSIREDMSQGTFTEEEAEAKKIAAKKTEKSKRHRRHLSGSISKADWTEKIYVLVTSGYLMQYAAEGPFDRIPEKMLQLSKDSVVFASDAIPGELFVLQVSQTIDSDKTPTNRSFLSRLRGAEYRRTTASFLLILENAEEMDDWLNSIRREIESLGGKKHVSSETGEPDEEEQVISPISRDFPKKPSNLSTVTTLLDPWSHPSEQQLGDSILFTTRPLSTVRPSMESPSVSTSALSKDEACLDSLRENSHHRLSHMSYMSSGPPTSRDSSPTCSPTREMSREGYSLDPIPDRRRSTQAVDMSPGGGRLSTPRSSRPHSTMVYTGIPKFRDYSPNPKDDPPSTPRQRSFTNPKVCGSNESLSHDLPSTPPVPRIPSTRKRTPPVLSKTLPLTPIEDSHSPTSPLHPQSPISLEEIYTRPQTAPPNRPPPPPPLPNSPNFNTLHPTPLSHSSKQYLRRPMSFQIKTNYAPPVSLHTHPVAVSPTSDDMAPRSPPRSSRSNKAFSMATVPGGGRYGRRSEMSVGNREFSESGGMNVKHVHRRSMPHLAEVYSAPLVPPPDCDLPPLPSGVGVR